MSHRAIFSSGFFLVFISLQGQVQFSNRSDLLHDSDLHSGVPVAIADMNGDGLDDIVALDEGTHLHVQYQTPGQDRAFVRYDLPREAANEAQNDIIVADFNNDGANDIFTIGSYDRAKLFYAIPFTYNFELTSKFVIPFFSQGASSGDFNGDGWLDIVVLNDNGLNYTFMNDGTGNLEVEEFFNFVTEPSSDNSGNYGSVYTDFDMDGDNDFYIAKCRQGVNNPADPRRINALFVNDGNNNYTQKAAEYGLANGRQTWTADFGDIDNDGDQDVFMTQHDVISELFENINNDTFINITQSAGLNIGGIPLQGLFRDFDNDGFQDILVSGDRIDFYHNNGDKTFTKMNLFGDVVFGTYALGDLNHDGFTDVYASRVIPFNNPDLLREDLLYLNQPNSNHFLAIELKNTGGNPSAIGAQVTLYGGWGIQTREVRAGEQYGVSNGHKLIFGMGQLTTYDSLIVRWPDGVKEHYDFLEADRHWLIQKGNCSSFSVKEWDELGIICGTDSIVLNLSIEEGNVIWSTGDTADSLVVKSSGIYFATISDGLGCPLRTSPVEIIMDPDTVRPTIHYVGSTELCHMDIAVLSLPEFSAYDWSDGQTTSQIEVSTSGDYFAQVQGYCKTLFSDTLTLNFHIPENPVTVNDTFIAGEDAVLLAIGDSIIWYDEMQSEIIGTGPQLTLTDLTDTTTVFAANVAPIEGENYQAGLTAHQGVSKYNAAFINGGMLFEVYKPIILNDLTVYTDSAGVRIIEIFGNSELVFSHEVMLEPGETIITLNAELAPGSYMISTNTDKNIETFGDASPILWRTLGGFTYPFEVPSIFSLTNSTFGEEFFYYFYDWHISTSERYCSSDLVPVTAYFDEMVSADGPEKISGVAKIYPNPSAGVVTIYLTSPVISYEILDLSGQQIKTIVMDEPQIEFQIDLSDLIQGLYFVKTLDSHHPEVLRVVRL